MLRSDPAATFRRVEALAAYMSANVLSPSCHGESTFICPSAAECRASVPDADYHEGQLSHVGEHYDLLDAGRPLRVVVVGQENGSAAEHVGLAARRSMILTGSGRNSRYRAVDGYSSRNPHMRGTTSALRLLLGRDAGDDREGEFLDLVSGERVHIFDAFALVNALLCSTHRRGTAQGQSTAVMRGNCQRHLAETLRLLEPTVIVLQGLNVGRWTHELFETVEPLSEHAELARFAGRELYLCRFTHPSARGSQRWVTAWTPATCATCLSPPSASCGSAWLAKRRRESNNNIGRDRELQFLVVPAHDQSPPVRHPHRHLAHAESIWSAGENRSCRVAACSER